MAFRLGIVAGLHKRPQDFAWRTGAWRQMSQADWLRKGASWKGSGMKFHTDHG